MLQLQCCPLYTNRRQGAPDRGCETACPQSVPNLWLAICSSLDVSLRQAVPVLSLVNTRLLQVGGGLRCLSLLCRLLL